MAFFKISSFFSSFGLKSIQSNIAVLEFFFWNFIKKKLAKTDGKKPRKISVFHLQKVKLDKTFKYYSIHRRRNKPAFGIEYILLLTLEGLTKSQTVVCQDIKKTESTEKNSTILIVTLNRFPRFFLRTCFHCSNKRFILKGIAGCLGMECKQRKSW